MEEDKKVYTIILRHDTSTNWMINNPILTLGEYGVEDDTHRVKRGNGEDSWENLTYEHFGLEYLISYANLLGDVEDNTALKEALDAKMSTDIFEDTDNTVVVGIKARSEDGKIGRFTKTIKNVITKSLNENSLVILSNDKTIQGVWTVDDTGARILDLKSVAKIDIFQPNGKYMKDQLCVYGNKIYRARKDFTAEDIFNIEDWILLTSTIASDILFEHNSGLVVANNVQDAIDEVAKIANTKLTKTNEINKIYGTDKNGNQILYDKDSLRTVDTVNGIGADQNKNIQIDASDINYDDEAETKRTIKQILDRKVNKDVAGEGNKIVQNASFTLNESDGTVTFKTKNLSLEDGSTAENTQTINIVSETELSNKLTSLNNAIRTDMTNKDNELDAKIDKTREDLEHNIEITDGEINARITNEVATLNNTINQKETALNERIDSKVKTVNDRIDTEVQTLNETINNNKTDIETKLTEGLNTKIDKDITDSLVSNIEVSEVEENSVMEPTLKITSKNTDTKTEIVQNVHFKAVGDIQTKMENDHIIVDSTNIDKKVQANIDHLTQVDTRLTNNETEIASLQQHDVNHESVLATHTQQIANHETRIAANETHLTNVDEEIEDIKAQHQTDINEIHTTNADQEAHLTRIDQTNLDQDERIQDNANSIIETNKNVSKNAQDITNLENKAVVYNKERNIDVENNIALKNNMMLTGATPTQYYNLASMKTYNLGLENELTQTEFGTSKVHMNLNSLDRPTIELPSSEKHEISYKDELDTAKTEINANIEDLNNTINETINTKLTELDTKKLDKAFTNNLVNTLTYTGPQSSELFKLNKQDINPNDNSTSNLTFTIKSSDNTLVAKPIMDGETLTGIDLATNLDVDVHYFVTSEILNTTIPSDNTIQISSLTDTTSDNVEVKDIISDAEGTWARVQEVNTEAGTLKCVTFAKHAQAVWGTVKGNIQDQQDLQEQFNTKLNWNLVTKIMTDINFNFSGADNNHISKMTIQPRRQIIDSAGEAHSFDMNAHRIDSSASIQIQKAADTNPTRSWFTVLAEGVDFDPLESGLTSDKLSPAVRELKGLIDDSNTEITKLQQNKVDKAMQELVQGIEASTFNKGTGELTFNYDAFDVTTNSTTKKSIVISDMFKQSDLDNKVDYSNFSLPYASGTQANISLDSGSDRLNTVNINLSYIDINSKDFAAKDYTVFGLNSTNNTIKYSSSEQGFITLDVNTDNIKVNTPNEGTENQKDIITAVQDLYKLPRITSYQDLAGFEMKPGMITYNVDSINNLAYLVICKTAYTAAADNLDEDFNTNITNGNLVRIGIPNEII